MSTVSSESDDVQLYASWFCPYAQRAWIAAEHKGIPYKYVEVDPYAKPPELLALNPRGLVPALKHGDHAVYESMVLVEYIDEAFPSNVNLLPKDPYQRAVAKIWADYVNKKVCPQFYTYLLKQTKEDQEAAKEEILKYYTELSAAMADLHPEGPYFMGPDFSYVDIILVPWVIRHHVLNHYRGFTVPDTSELARFNKWAKAALEVPSVKATLQDEERLNGDYAKYAFDRTQSQVAVAIRKDKTLP